MSGKNKKSIVKYKDINVDSVEEFHFFCWLDAALDLNIVKKYEYQPPAFILTEKQLYVPYYNNIKKKEKHLLREHIYTPDFKIVFNAVFGCILNQYFKIDESMLDAQTNTITIYVDVKGTFNRSGGDRLFSIHQKLVYDKYKILIQKVVPKELFKILGISRKNLKTPTGRPSKIYSSYNFIDKAFGLTQ